MYWLLLLLLNHKSVDKSIYYLFIKDLHAFLTLYISI